MCYCTIVLEAGVAVFIGAYVAEEPTVAADTDENGEDCGLFVRMHVLAGG